MRNPEARQHRKVVKSMNESECMMIILGRMKQTLPGKFKENYNPLFSITILYSNYTKKGGERKNRSRKMRRAGETRIEKAFCVLLALFLRTEHRLHYGQ